MKNIISITFFFFFVSFSLHASKVAGIIITKRDTLHVSFIIPLTGIDYSAMQSGIKYVDSLDNKYKLRPEDAKEFRFEYNGEHVRMLSRFNNLNSASDGSTKIFLHLLIDGSVKLFNYYVTSSRMYTPGAPGTAPMMTGGGSSRKYVLQKGIGDLVRYDKINFKDDMPIFVKKCPDLVKMIQDKVYVRSDIERIVTYYNTNCGSN